VPTFLLASFRQQPAVPVSLRIAIRIGFVILLMSLAVGALMIAKGMRLVFAGDPQAAYATGGALKPTHAAAMHAILVLPLLAWLLSFTDWSERRRVGVVLLGTAGICCWPQSSLWRTCGCAAIEYTARGGSLFSCSGSQHSYGLLVRGFQ
jgi:hypothetical protein